MDRHCVGKSSTKKTKCSVGFRHYVVIMLVPRKIMGHYYTKVPMAFSRAIVNEVCLGKG